MKTDCVHSPIYDKQTGGSKCKKCGVLLNDFNQEYPEVKESCNDSGGGSPLNTAHPPTSELISNLEAYAVMYENLKAEYETQSSTVKQLERKVERLKKLLKDAHTAGWIDSLCEVELMPTIEESWQQFKTENQL